MNMTNTTSDINDNYNINYIYIFFLIPFSICFIQCCIQIFFQFRVNSTISNSYITQTPLDNITIINDNIEKIKINSIITCIICYENVKCGYKFCDIKTDHYYCLECFEKIKNEYNKCVICNINNKIIKIEN